MRSDVKFRKQISIFIPLEDWKALRIAAAEQRVPMTELCRRWMEPGLNSLRKPPCDSSGSREN